MNIDSSTATVILLEIPHPRGTIRSSRDPHLESQALDEMSRVDSTAYLQVAAELEVLQWCTVRGKVVSISREPNLSD